LHFRLICEIKLNLQSWLTSNVEVIVDMASRMIDKFDKYWSEMNGLLAISSMLDPRNKLDCVDFYFKEIYKGEAPREIEKITSFLYDLLVEYVEKKVKVLVAEDPTLSTPSQMAQTSSDLSQKRPFEEEDCQDRFAAHKKTKKTGRST